MSNRFHERRQLAGLRIRRVADGLPERDELIAIHDLWRCKGRDGRLPGRRDFPVAGLRRWIGSVSLVDVSPGPRFRWRLVGTRIVEALGRDSTGRWFDELYDGETLSSFVDIHAAILDGRRPAWCSGDLEFAGGEALHASAIVLPLAQDGRSVDMVMLVAQFD